jgi:hypothetical protein
MSKMSELHADVMDAVEQGMSAKFLVATFGISFETAEQLIEERYNEELCKQHEMMSYAAELENFSPFDTVNS